MRWLPGVERAVPAGVAAVAASYAYAGFTREFVVAPLTRIVVRFSPDSLVGFAITQLGSTAQTLVLAASLVAAAGLFGAAGAIGWAAGDTVGREWVAIPVGAVAAGLLGWLLAPTWEVGIVTGLAVGLVLTAFAVPVSGSAPGAPRRRVLRAAAGVAASAGVGSLLASERTYSADSVVRDPVAVDLLEGADARSLAVPDVEPLVSRSFYEVDVNVVNPRVRTEDWTLSVTGSRIDTEYDFDALREFDVEHRFVTLRCVGDALNGRKMDTALWTGIPVRALLSKLDAPTNCCVVTRAADDYHQEFPQAALRDGLLAFRMNGKPLPRAHGAPVRLLVPGHWGEINVKWLDEIELRDEPATGYWEERGWHGTGPVNTVAKLHHAERDGDRVTVGGHAYAGTRGVSRVEVSPDGGETWREAELSPRLPGAHGEHGSQLREMARDAWRQWRYKFTASGEREVVVRTVESDGTVQPRERSAAKPDGASGWVSERV
ncbi:molybdopterin-dependent oxidoreductase [Halobacterium wangiae]|uniref:molybdopterin-dependent oxidoreductase n=1 Tax=Halobacterium wangiae TaxID=2902623 RepID=UPI001E560FEA|nr:molybdopterin-dependent oxidoreductase [Halobacterium wangiae]